MPPPRSLTALFRPSVRAAPTLSIFLVHDKAMAMTWNSCAPCRTGSYAISSILCRESLKLTYQTKKEFYMRNIPVVEYAAQHVEYSPHSYIPQAH